MEGKVADLLGLKDNYSRRGKIKHKNIGNKSVDCAFCRGHGEITGKITCPACKGSGKVKFSGAAIRCIYCRGSGRDRSNTRITCLACKGIGAISVREGFETCDECYGTGQKPGSVFTCTPCKGTGVV